MNEHQLKTLALALLDDEHGISSDAFDVLHNLLNEAGLVYLTDNVKATEGRHYITSEEAQRLS